MKTVQTKTALIAIILSLSTIAFGQTFSAQGYKRGNIQWQSSADQITWTDISNANQETFENTDTETEMFYRMRVTDESCDPLYSPVYKVGEPALSPISFDQVELQDDFWSKRMKIQKEVLVPIALERTEPSVENLRRTANFLKGIPDNLPTAHRFMSSDLYKVLEGAAYLLKKEPDAELETQMDEIIQIIADAQQEDGYHYEAHITGVAHLHDTWGGGGMGDKPYSWVLHSHELYNMGHLYEAAVAYYQATGKRNLLNVAIKNAKHIYHVFFEGDPNYNNGNPVNQAPGHQEIELALIKLYRVTGDSQLLDLAKRFIDIRGVTYKPEGNGVMSASYAQQHLPVREQTEAVGHAVRATYLYSGMADVSLLTNDKTLRPALETIWNDIVNTRMHITGGLGAIHGIEGFGPQYELPNANAYNETCAAVGNVLFNHRMFLLEKDGKYMDVAEVSLLNNVLAGVNMEGNKFFYVNPLEHDGIKPINQGVSGRAEWFGTACCPTNLARLIPQVSGLMYAYTEDELYCSFYAGSEVNIPLASGTVNIKQETNYPFDGTVNFTVGASQPFSLKLRIPTWARIQFVPGELYHYTDNSPETWTISVNGQPYDATAIEKGFVEINRTWSEGDKVVLSIPMPVRKINASNKVEANIDRVAISRGPLVYCAEGVDNEAAVHSFFVDNSSEFAHTVSKENDGILSGINKITFNAKSVKTEGAEETPLTMIPYYAWSNRGASPMMVWLPEKEELVRENYSAEDDFIESITASHTFSGDALSAIVDGETPISSSDNSISRWTSWDQRGQDQWIEVTMSRPIDIASVEIYWYDDNGGVKPPVSWNLEYEKDGNWHSFSLCEGNTYGVNTNQYNKVRTAEVSLADKLRINMKPQSDACVGILELLIGQPKGVIRSVTASHTYLGLGDYKGDTENAIIDGKIPTDSYDESIRRWTSWQQTGQDQWVEFLLTKETSIQSLAVYWYDDNGGVLVPASWNLQYKTGNQWVEFPLYTTDYYSVDKNKFNLVHPGEPITTKNIRMNIKPKDNAAVGILEVMIEETE